MRNVYILLTCMFVLVKVTFISNQVGNKEPWEKQL